MGEEEYFLNSHLSVLPLEKQGKMLSRPQQTVHHKSKKVCSGLNHCYPVVGTQAKDRNRKQLQVGWNGIREVARNELSGNLLGMRHLSRALPGIQTLKQYSSNGYMCVCMFMCVYVCACTYVCICVCMCIYMHTLYVHV